MGKTLHAKFRRIAEEIYEKYKDLFTTDYLKNRKILENLAEFPSKKLRNKLAGFITRKVKSEIS